MNTTDNFPKTESQNPIPNKSYKNAIIGVLAAGVIGLGGFLVVDKNKSGEVIHQQETQIASVSEEKIDIQISFNASLARLDSMSTANKGLEGKLTAKNSEIAKVKTEIRSILNKRNATNAELSRAKMLIESLNGQIESMQVEVARLTQENQVLSNDKVVLTGEKEKLTADLTSTTEVKQA